MCHMCHTCTCINQVVLAVSCVSYVYVSVMCHVMYIASMEYVSSVNYVYM